MADFDIPFAMRICVQGLSDSSYKDYTALAGELSTALKQKMDGFSSAKTGFEESCPACSQTIPLTSLSFGICPNGHQWGE